ncbi:MAG: (Fe-S)-binding protein [Deltaproteobacteria bacterium]|nr:(Fe-S)-binding protein [Deltaproteobacteria bacterium]
MHALEVILILLVLGAGTGSFGWLLWTRRLKHVWPKMGEIKVINAGGAVTGALEVMLQSKVLANRPLAGLAHALLFYGFLLFSIKSGAHVLAGLIGEPIELPLWLTVPLDVAAVVVLGSLIFFGIRRWTVMKDQLTHLAESTFVLSMIGALMVTHLAEHAFVVGSVGAQVNWWIHFVVLAGFPSLIAYGKHLHLVVAPFHVMMKHMVEVPSDRPIPGGDFDASLMLEEPEGEEAEADLDRRMTAELARVGMPNGLIDMGVHALLDPAACIECGRCNDACPGGPGGLKPRDHFVLPFRLDSGLVGEIKVKVEGEEDENEGPSAAEKVVEVISGDTLALCTQCRACDNVCPVGNRPSLTALELRGRMHFEGEYPPMPMKEGGANPVSATGNIFGQDPADRTRFIESNDMPYYDPAEHDVLLILGCQGSYAPEAQPAVVATARLLEAAGIKYGVLEEEQCWGEGLMHGGGMMEEWPFYSRDRIEFLTEALGGDPTRTMITVDPHAKDMIKTQYGALGANFSDVRSHVAFLDDLVSKGKIKLNPVSEALAAHHPCKTIHNDEAGAMSHALVSAGIKLHTSGGSPTTPACCGGGGGGFLWDSPAKVNSARYKGIVEETGLKKIVTSCPGCHRMLSVAKDEDAIIIDLASVLLERLEPRA